MSNLKGHGLTAGTHHLLMNRFSQKEKSFLWTGTGWGSHGWETPPRGMAFAGWSYSRPESTPTEESKQ